jgi:hypothetical protein
VINTLKWIEWSRLLVITYDNEPQVTCEPTQNNQISHLNWGYWISLLSVKMERAERVSWIRSNQNSKQLQRSNMYIFLSSSPAPLTLISNVNMVAKQRSNKTGNIYRCPHIRWRNLKFIGNTKTKLKSCVFGANRACTKTDKIKTHRKIKITQKNGLIETILVMFEIFQISTGPDFRWFCAFWSFTDNTKYLL